MENLYNLTEKTDLVIDAKNVKKIAIVYNTNSKQFDYFVESSNATAQIDNKTYQSYAKKGKTVDCGITLNEDTVYCNYELCQEYHLGSKSRYFHLNVNGKNFLTTNETYKILLKHRKAQSISVKLKNSDFNVKSTVEKMTRIYFVDKKFQKSYFVFNDNKFEVTNEMYNFYSTTVKNTESYLELNNQLVAVNDDVINFYKSSDKKESKENKKLSENNVISYYNIADKEKQLCIKDIIVDESIVPVEDKMVNDEMIEILISELDALSSEELEIIKGLFVENITQTDLANKLGISQQTLNYRKKKILKKFNSKFSSKGINNLIYKD